MSDNKPHLYSSHIFMFPFRFDWNEDGFEKEYDFYKSQDINKRVTLEKLNLQLTDNGWAYREFKIDGKNKHLLYNEFTYFYDYARDSIYNSFENFSKDAISNYYMKDELKGEIFELKIKAKEEPYKLTIKKVTLRVFNTGIAILSLELENNTYKNFKDILRINDFGRRVYPQYIGEGDDLSSIKKSFLAESIKIGTIEEDFQKQDFTDTTIGEHIMELLGKNVFSQKKNKSKRYYIQPSLDDRMFVLSWYANDTIMKRLQKREGYKESNCWYEYIFVDGNGTTVQNTDMKKELLENATYDRWSGYGTLWGVSRYSMVLFTNKSGSFTKNHLETMYFQMISILLATRTSILRFSDEIAALIIPDKTINTNKLTKLYQRYLTFYNRLYFKELTHQDQGIELYDMALKQMKIDEHMEKLDRKFEKLFEFANLQENKRLEQMEKERLLAEEKVNNKRSKEMDKLTIMGAIFLPPSLMISLLSMGIFDYKQSYDALFIGIFFIVLSALVTIGILNFGKRIKAKKIISTIAIALVVLVVALIPFKLIGVKKDKPNDVKISNEVLNVKIDK